MILAEERYLFPNLCSFLPMGRPHPGPHLTPEFLNPDIMDSKHSPLSSHLPFPLFPLQLFFDSLLHLDPWLLLHLDPVSSSFLSFLSCLACLLCHLQQCYDFRQISHFPLKLISIILLDQIMTLFTGSGHQSESKHPNLLYPPIVFNHFGSHTHLIVFFSFFFFTSSFPIWMPF